LEKKLEKQVHDRALLGAAPTRSDFLVLLETAMKEEAEATTGCPQRVQLPSSSTVDKLFHEVAPKTVRVPSVQTKRRLEAGADVFNFLSMAVVARVTFAKTKRDLTINTDATSILLEGDEKPVHISPRVEKELADEGRSVTRTETEPKLQRRSVELLVSTSAAGQLVSVICIVTDHKITKFQFKKVRG
jgi:hypothetical protein